jgi:hypothetical protein
MKEAIDVFEWQSLAPLSIASVDLSDNLTEAPYHADPTPQSSSAAKQLELAKGFAEQAS